MKKAGIVLLGLIVLIVVAVFVAPRVIDWNGYKDDIAQGVKDATGHDLAIGGDIEVSIFPGIAFQLSDVRLSNAAGAGEPEILSLESVRGKLGLFPLISRKVVVEELIVTRLIVRLTVDEAGRANWASEARARAPRELASTAEAEEGLPISDLVLGDVRLVDGLVTYRDARSGQEVTAKTINLTAALAGLSAPFSLDGSLTVNEEPVTLKVAMDSPGGLLAGQRAALTTALEAPRIALGYDGGVQQKPVPALDGTFNLDIPSVGELAAWLGRPLAADQSDPGPLKVQAVFEGEGARMTLTQATIEGTALQAKASGGIDASGEVRRITFNIEAGVLDLDRYMPPHEQGMAEHHATMAERHERMAETGAKRDVFQAIPDNPFDLAPFKQTEAEINVAIGGIRAMGFEVGNIGFGSTLSGGVLAADLTELRLYDGNVTGTLRLDGSGQALGVAAALAIDKVNVGKLARAAQGDQAKVAGIASGKLDATGSGQSPRALAQSLVAAATLSLGGIDVKDAPGAISKLDLAVDVPGVEASPSVKGSVVYNKEAVAFSLGLDPLSKVLSGERFNARLAVDSRRVKLDYDGAVQRAPVPGLDGRFGLDVPSVAGLLAWLEKPLPKGQPDPGPLKVTAVLAADGPRAALKEARIEGAALNATASGSYDGSGEVAKISLDLEAGVLDIDRYLPPPAPEATAAPPARPAATGGPLAALPDEPFDLDPLRKTEARVNLALGGLKAMGYELGKTQLAANLAGGRLDTDLREMRLYGGNVTGAVKLDGAGDALGVEAAVALDKVDVGKLARAAQGDRAKVAGIASGRLTAKGRGKSPRALAESLAAQADLRLGGIDLKQAGAGTLSEADVALDMPGMDRRTTLKASAVYNAEKVALDLDLAPLTQVLSEGAFDLTAALASDLLSARYAGKVQREPAPGLDGSLDLNVPSVGRLAAWVGQPLGAGQPDPGPLTVKATLAADGAKAALKQATIDGKALKATASGSLDTSQAVKRFDAKVEIIEADLNAYLPPRQEAAPAKPAASPAPAGPAGWSEEPIDASPLRQAEGQAVVNIGKMRYGDLDISNGTATVTLANGVLQAVLQQLQMAGGTVALDATVDGAQKAPAVAYQVSVAGVQARPVLKTFAGNDRLSGTADFQASGRTQGANQKQMVGALNGDGRFMFRDGAIHGINLAATLRQAKTFSLGDPSGEQKTDFAELSGSFVIVNGVLENRDLKMLAPLLRVTGGGLVPMPPRTVDYTAEAKLVGTLQGQGGREALAGLPIPITVKGSWDKPSFGVDWKSVFAAAAQDPERLANMPGELRNFGESLGVKLPIPGAEGGLGGVLQGIPGLPGGARPQQEPGAQAQPSEPAAGAVGVLKQLLQPQESEPTATQPAQPAPTGPAPTGPAPSQPEPAPAPPQPSPTDALKGLKKLFGN